MKNIIRILPIIFLLISCGGEYDDEYDFRNHLRDTHPYCELIKVDALGDWGYQVNDTIKGEVWIYLGQRQKSRVKAHCINCREEK